MWQLSVITCLCILSLKIGHGNVMLIEAAKDFFAFKTSIPQDHSMLSCLKVLPMGIIASLVVALPISQTFKFFGLYSKDDSNTKLLISRLKENSLISFVLFIFLFEEGIFRIIPILVGNYMNWNIAALLIIFNVAFALVHLGNFKDASNLLIILPHFLVGLVFCVVAYKFGIITAFLVHLYYDFALFSLDRNIKYNPVTLLVTIYYGVIAFVGYQLTIKNIPDLSFLTQWTGTIPPDLKLSFEQSLGVIMLSWGAVKFLGNVAGFDNITPHEIEKYKPKTIFLFGFGATVFTCVFTFLSSWLITNPFASYPYLCALGIAIIFVGFNSHNSLSESAFNAFKIPASAFSIVIYAIIGPLAAIPLILTEFVISLPDMLLLVNSERID
jgi:hypothetical protein